MYGIDLDQQMREEWKKIPESCIGMPLRFRHGPCVFGCDLRPGVFDLVLAESIQGERQRVFRPIFMGKLGNPIQVLAVLQHYKPLMGLVDIRPDFTSTRAFQLKLRDWGIECWRVQYPTNPHDPTEEIRDDAEGILTLHRSQSLDKVWMAFRAGHNICLPENFEMVGGGTWARELTAGVRVFKESRGKMALFWEKRSEHDDALHAVNYCFHAWHMAGLDTGDGNRLAGPITGERDSLFKTETPHFGYNQDEEAGFFEA